MGLYLVGLFLITTLQIQSAIAEDNDASEALSKTDLIIREIKGNCNQNENPECYCPEIFDGWTCWNATPPGTTAYHPCPSSISGFDSKRFAHKECMEDGTWFRHPKTHMIWSNYTTCFDLEDSHTRNAVVTIQDVGYLIPTVLVIIPLIIFKSFCSLMENSTIENELDGLSSVELIKLQIESDCYQSESVNITEFHCPQIFDGWSCWNSTPVGTTAYQKCPSFIEGFDAKRFAHKECMEDGTWFRHPISNRTWSNFSTCVNLEDLQIRETLITIQEIGYLLSIIALIIALVIFNTFRQLQCTRVAIHKHLFVSFIISNVAWLIWYRVIIANPHSWSQIWCNILDGLVKYFMIANYFWIFCEGYYLHYIVVFPFSRDGFKPLKGFILFGWICSVIPVVLYYYFSLMDAEDICMALSPKWGIMIYVPVGIISIINFGFLINIVRVLCQSVFFLTQSSTFSATSALVKSTRATLILIPILGLNFLFSFQHSVDSEYRIIHEFVTGIFFPFQGLFVSFLFCIFNTDVLEALRREGFCWRDRLQPETVTTLS